MGAHEPVTLEELADGFYLRMESEGYAPGSIKRRREALGVFLRYCAARAIHYAPDVMEDEIRRYIEYLDHCENSYGNRFSREGRRARLIALRMFFRDLVRRGVVLYDPVAHIVIPRRDRIIPRVILSAVEVERICALPDTGSPIGLRDRAILEVLYATGIRRAELCDLSLSDAELSGGTLRIRRGKGGKERFVPLGERCRFWLTRYLAEGRNALLRSRPVESLFVNVRGERVNPWTLSELVGEYVKVASVKKGACHLFRHACATHMLEGGADIRFIQEMLGHESVETTRVYTRVSAKRLREVHRRSHPAPEYEPDGEKRGKRRPIQRVYRMRPPARGISGTGGDMPDGEEVRLPGDLEAIRIEYRTYLKTDGYSPVTQKTKRIALERFFAFCRESGVRNVTGITPDLLDAYAASLTEHRKENGEGLSVISRYNLLRDLREFCRWLKRAGHLLRCPSDRLDLPRIPRRLPGVHFTAEEAELLLSQPDVSLPYGIRDRAILELLYGTGMRRSELISLRIEDIDFESGTVYIRASKNGDSRHVPATRRAFVWLAKFMEEVRPQFVHGEDPGDLFLSSYGERMCVDYITQICKRYMRLAGIEKRGSCHLFRHTCATLMLENGADIRSVQELLGHRDLTNTQLYTHVAIRKLREVHAITHPGEVRFRERRKRMETEDTADAVEGV
jgi:integrase/recombinase XerD